VELDGNTVKVVGPRGTLSRRLPEQMQIAVADSVVTVARPSESKEHKSLHGLTRTLVANMVTGVSAGYTRVVELYGMGFRWPCRAALNLQIGFSHPVHFDLPGISTQVKAFRADHENQHSPPGHPDGH
jgi:large subunit ribosomal protein L6